MSYAVFDDAPVGVIVIGADGRIVYVNRRQCTNSQLSPEHFLGKEYRPTFGPTLERAGLLDDYDRLVAEGTPFEAIRPNYRRHSDGTALAFCLRGYRSGDDLILITSIETALAAQLARYEKLFENANDGIFILTRDGRFAAVNQAFADMTGMPRERILGETTEIFLPGRFEQSLARLERILAEGRLGPYELEVSTPLGPRFISLNGFALVEDGRPVGVMNIARDTTEEHRRAQERETLYQFSHDLARSLDVSEVAARLFERTQTLLDAEASLLILCDSLGDALRAVDGTGDGTRWERPATNGDWSAERALCEQARTASDGIAEAEIEPAPGRGRRRVRAVALAGGDRIEGFLLVAAGSEGPAPSDLHALRLLAYESAQAIGRARLADELRDARDQALEASRLKSAFVANMSHEIRTPLNVILGFSSIIAERLAERGEDVDEEVSGIRRAGERLLETIHHILDISKIEAHAFEVRPAEIDVPRLVRRLMADLGMLAKEKSLSLRCEIEELRARIRFDEYCLAQALTNLLQNAIKFTDEGGVTVRLQRDADGRLQLEVRDTGIGIGPEHLGRLFEPFSQEDSGWTRRFDGSGLGLALTKSYLDLNGATISVESEKGVGSCFVIHFPRECEITATRPAA